MIRQSEAARTAAQFLSFGSFFLSCPLGLWDSCLFAQISFDRVLEVAVVDGLCVAGFMASLALGLGSMARGTARVPKPLAVAGALVYGMGLCLYAVIQGADVPVSAFGAAVMGAAIGAGLAVVVVGWCRLLARFGLRRSLVGLGIACGAAALAGLGFEMDVLPQPLSAFMAFALAGAVAPAIDSLRSSVESEESVVGDNAVEQDAPVEHLWDSMRTMVFNPCLGLCLFLFVMSARGFVFMGYEHIGASSVIVAAVLAVVLARFWPGFSLATIYRVLLPVAAAIFIVLSSFPVGTMSFSLGFLVSHSVMATVALLALASLAAVARAGEFSPVVVGAALCAMTSVAVLVGSNLAQLVPQDDTMGAVLLVCAMAYFVYILISRLQTTIGCSEKRMALKTSGREPPAIRLNRSTTMGCAPHLPTSAICRPASARSCPTSPAAIAPPMWPTFSASPSTPCAPICATCTASSASTPARNSSSLWRKRPAPMRRSLAAAPSTAAEKMGRVCGGSGTRSRLGL